jgi:hypothetical protein
VAAEMAVEMAAEVVAEIAAEVAAEVVAEVAAEVVAEVTMDLVVKVEVAAEVAVVDISIFGHVFCAQKYVMNIYMRNELHDLFKITKPFELLYYCNQVL